MPTEQTDTDERVPVRFEIPRSLDRRIEIMAAVRDMPKRQLYEDAVRSYLDAQEGTEVVV